MVAIAIIIVVHSFVQLQFVFKSLLSTLESAFADALLQRPDAWVLGQGILVALSLLIPDCIELLFLLVKHLLETCVSKNALINLVLIEFKLCHQLGFAAFD